MSAKYLTLQGLFEEFNIDIQKPMTVTGRDVFGMGAGRAFVPMLARIEATTYASAAGASPRIHWHKPVP